MGGLPRSSETDGCVSEDITRGSRARAPTGGRHHGLPLGCEFRLEAIARDIQSALASTELDHNGVIAPKVERIVRGGDLARWVKCGSDENLHFDHISPFARAGPSLTAENIQLLCAGHNLEKRDRIEQIRRRGSRSIIDSGLTAECSHSSRRRDAVRCDFNGMQPDLQPKRGFRRV